MKKKGNGHSTVKAELKTVQAPEAAAKAKKEEPVSVDKVVLDDATKQKLMELQALANQLHRDLGNLVIDYESKKSNIAARLNEVNAAYGEILRAAAAPLGADLTQGNWQLDRDTMTITKMPD